MTTLICLWVIAASLVLWLGSKPMRSGVLWGILLLAGGTLISTLTFLILKFFP